MRYTGKPFPFPVGYHVEPDGVKLTFDQPWTRSRWPDLSHYKVGRWNYRWSARLRLEALVGGRAEQSGHDPVNVTAATLGADGRSVTLKFADMRPAMQTKIEYDLKAADGSPRKGAVYATIREWK